MLLTSILIVFFGTFFQATAGAFDSVSGCEWYADEAVFQNKRNIHRDCGYGTSARWQSNHKNHRDWCLNEAKPGWPEKEDAIRSKALKQCRPSRESRENFNCSRYADAAVYYNTRNLHCKCGYGPNATWQSNYKNHRAWCLDLVADQGSSVLYTATRKEQDKRINKLGSCRCAFKRHY